MQFPIIDTILIAMIAMSFSGILRLTPSGTFGYSWLERAFDVFTIFYIFLKPDLLLSLRPVMALGVWLLLYYSIGYYIAEPSEEVTNAIAQAGLIYLPLMLRMGIVLRGRKQWEEFAAAMQAVAIGAGFISVAQALIPRVWSFTMAGFEYDTMNRPVAEDRFPALWINPNQAGVYFFFLFVLSFWCRPRWLRWSGRMAALIGIILTVSRSAWLILALFVFGYVLGVLFLRAARNRSILSVGTGVVASFIGLILLTGAIVWVLPSQRTKILNYLNDPAVTERLETDSAVQAVDLRSSLLRYWYDKAAHGPWYGQGLRSFQMSDNVIEVGCHNHYLMVYGEVGIFGILTYLLILGIGVRRCTVISMSGNNRLILLLTWGLFLFAQGKAHTFFDERESYVIWGLLFIAPWVLVEKAGNGTQRLTEPSAPKGTPITPP